MNLNIELLNWFSSFINFLIFVYITLSIVNTQCFNVFQMSLSLIGLLSTIIMQMISVFIKTKIGKDKK
jgi:hypothetical protein